MNRQLIMLGAGGHAKVLLDTLLTNGEKISCILEKNLARLGEKIFDIPIFEENEKLNEFPIEIVRLANGIGSVTLPHHRQKIFDRYKEQGYLFQSIIHPSSVMAREVKIGEGVQIMAGVIIQSGVSLGANTIINTKVSVDHDCIIGSHVHLAPGVTLSGGVTIGEGSHIGTGSSITQGVRIGSGVLIEAGSLITRDLPDGSHIKAIRNH